jgi:hypothetical protein
MGITFELRERKKRIEQGADESANGEAVEADGPNEQTPLIEET